LTIDAPHLLHAAALAAGAQQYPAPALYLVATPIGNLADLTLRALHVLALADTVACEDTRNTGVLLRHLGLTKPLLALHAHNESQAAQRVAALLAQGQRVAVVSDAGTPAVSDPGAAVVAAVAAAGHRVVPVPGPSSAVAAVSVAGDVQAQGFRFRGFLPPRGAERAQALAAVVADAGQQVLFEAPHRIEALARELAQAAPGRGLTLCRELTKQFETVATMDTAALAPWLAGDANRLRGEFVVVLHAAAPATTTGDALPPAAQQALRVLLEELPLKQAVALAARLTGAPRKALYAWALALRARADDDEDDAGGDQAPPTGGGGPA
jgi:16S rRNA (cytidine1402-2'-O)-methyltransferase